MIKLDLLDRKILFELDINARMPLTQIAKKTRSSTSVIEYRIKRFEKEGIIKNYLTFLDAGKLGLSVWNVYLKFQNINSNLEKKLYLYLCSLQQAWWVASCSGKWDAILSICVKDIKEFHSILKEVHNAFGEYILEQTIVAHAEVEIISRGYFLNKRGESKSWYKTIENIPINNTDKKILRATALNARESTVEIAKKSGLSARVVAYRLKELQKKGIIHRYRLVLDVKKIGMSFYKVIIMLKEYTTKKNEALKEYCINEGNIIHYEQKVGPWMLELELDAENYESANIQLKKMKERFPEFIQNYDLLLITEEHKSDLDLTKYT